MGLTPTRDRVLRIGFLVLEIVHKNANFRLLEALELVCWLEAFTRGEVSNWFVFMCSHKGRIQSGLKFREIMAKLGLGHLESISTRE